MKSHYQTATKISEILRNGRSIRLMNYIIFVAILLLPTHLFARNIAKDINILNHIYTYQCDSSHKVNYKTTKSKFKQSSYFTIPVQAGGHAKFNSKKLNFLFEADFSETIKFSLKQLDGARAFPYKMNKKTDKKTFIHLDIMAGKNIVYSLHCKRT